VHSWGGGAETEAFCDRWAGNYKALWSGPVASYLAGDPGPVRELCKTMAWGRQQAERKRLQLEAAQNAARISRLRWKAAAIRGRQEVAAQAWAEINRQHGVKSVLWRPGWAAPFVVFEERALKSAAWDPVIEEYIRRSGITDPKGIEFLRRTWARRKKYVQWVKELIARGLIPGRVTASI